MVENLCFVLDRGGQYCREWLGDRDCLTFGVAMK